MKLCCRPAAGPARWAGRYTAFSLPAAEGERGARSPQPPISMSLLSQSEEAEPERFDGLSLLYWTIMGPYGINRAVQRIVFSDCENGLGIKVIGGFKEQTGEAYGIYVKRILQSGIAASDGRLQPGDLILEVNGEDLAGVTNERAVDILRTASASSHMSLLIARDDESRREFTGLMEKYGSQSNTGSARSSPTPHIIGRCPESPTSSSSGSLSPKDAGPSAPTAPSAGSHGAVQLISVPRGLGLGLNISGGTNKPDGPMVHVQEVVPGGECHKDGRLRAGDQLVSVNKESLVGVTHDEARSILTRLKLRAEDMVEIAFMRRSSQSENAVVLSNPPPVSPSSSTAPKPPGFSFLLPPPSHQHGPTTPVQSLTDDTASLQFTQGKSAGKKDRSPAGSPTRNLPDPSSAVSVSPAWPQPSVPRGRSLSLNPSFRLKVEKLEMALGYLGIEPTQQQQQALRRQLQVDSKGTVAYGDFVQTARDLFRLQLDDTASESVEWSVASLSETARATQVPLSTSVDAEDLERITQERDEALKELKKVKEELAQSETNRKQLSEDLQKARQEVRSAVEEGRCLRSRVHLAEAAQRQAQGMEMDYEEVIRLLEAEITELKAQLADQHGQTKGDTQDLRKRIAVLDCQLRKSESARKGFEVSTEKLLQFVEMVHELLLESPAAPTNVCGTGIRRFSGPPTPQNVLSRYGHGGPGTLSSLSADAKELAKSVRSIVETDFSARALMYPEIGCFLR
ncbi:LOW QUALITY PROTEIN: syntaxin-binding protein 4-like [Mobula birostris]|uniref:LOW QUALITY PROTEIN: syntaxin-binding protein 4-like n=1 Tax=Mobula birostris TaxID=1983395 RepID=UPI003B286A48